MERIILSIFLTEEENIIKGIIEKNIQGFGFVNVEDKKIYVSKNDMNGAMDGDTVLLDMFPEYLWRKNPEAAVQKILKRGKDTYAGVFYRRKNFAFVECRGESIYVSKKYFSGAKTGDKVICQIIKYPTKYEKAEGKIVEIFARMGDENGYTKYLVRSRGHRFTFPSRASAEAKAVSKQDVNALSANRKDLRSAKVITIDGEHSKDLDDGISIEKNNKGNYILSVHIADVSHYVKEDEALDIEALKRGNSIYLLDTVLPMLPKSLSNGACSLNEGEEKLALSCSMEIDARGKVVDYSFYESIIISKGRLYYNEVSDLLEMGKDAPCYNMFTSKYKAVYKDLLIMYDLYKVLKENRQNEGSIDFDIEETEIELNENHVPIYVGAAQRRTANMMIEEFMLITNKTVAEHFYWLNIPFIYRVHEKPSLDKLSSLQTFLKGLSIPFPNNIGNIHPKVLSDVLNKVENTKYKTVVTSVMLRTMSKAFYSDECMGHFGLSFKYYCHFTSPIRRYADLMIHRIIKRVIRGENITDIVNSYKNKISDIADHISKCEVEAMEMERDLIKYKKAQYMETKVGEEYDAIVSGVTDFGMFASLENTVEGLIPLSAMKDDYYIYDEEKHCLIGEMSRTIYSPGDSIRIKVVRASKEEKQIDFQPVKGN